MTSSQTFMAKKVRRNIITYTKEMLKEKAELLNQDFNIEIPKDIINMDNLDFAEFVERIHAVIIEQDNNKIEIVSLVDQLERCIKAYRYYHYNIDKHMKGAERKIAEHFNTSK